MVARRWLVEVREFLGISAPVEIARVNDNTGDSRSVAANPLRARVSDNICSMFKGANEITSASKCVVDLISCVDQY